MIALPALAFALVAAAELAAGPPPQALPAVAQPGVPPQEPQPSLPAYSTPPAPDPYTGPGGVLVAPPSAPPVPAPLGHRREWSVSGGWLDTRLMGVSAQGIQLRATRGFVPAGQRLITQLVLDVFGGETLPGLPLRGGSLGLEIWTDASRRERAGLGAGLGAISYRRFTSPGEWPVLVTAGVRAGIEIDVWRMGAGTIILGAHGSASFGPWVSGFVSAGFRGGAAVPGAP